MVVVSIDSAIAKLEGGSIKSRNEGLEELRNLLKQGRNSQGDALKDEFLHKKFEVLFQIVHQEKPAFLKSLKSASKGSTAHRLEVIAAALRILLEAGASNLKCKTAFSVLEHVVATLPIHGNGLCEPIRNDYLRCFRILLEQTQYGEHFKHKQWQSYVDFVCDCLGDSDVTNNEDNTDHSSRDLNVSFRNGQAASLRTSQLSGSHHYKRIAETHLDDLLGSMKCLTALTNAPIVSRGWEICDTLIATLRSSQRAQDLAWGALNDVVKILVNENVGMTRQVVLLALPLIRELWSTKSEALKEEMLSTLIICRDILTESTPSADSSFEDEVERLLETMLHDFISRSEREMLQTIDIDFRRNDYSRALRINSFSPKSTQALNTMATLSMLASLLLRGNRPHKDVSNDDGSVQGTRKRRKILTPLEDLIEKCRSGSNLERLAHIQVLLFVVEQTADLPEGISSSLALLADGVRAEESLTVSWSFMLLASIIQKANDTFVSHFADLYDSICTSASRGLSSASTCRPACWLLRTTIKAQLVRGVPVSFLASRVFPNGSSGPCVMTDTSLMLLTDALLCGRWTDPGAFETYALRSVNWLRLSWTLPPVLNRLHNAQLAAEASVEQIHNLLVACSASSSFSLSRSPIVLSGCLAQSCASAIKSADFSAYLLVVDGWTALPEPPVIAEAESTVDQATSSRMQAAILELLVLKAKEFYDSWNVLAAERRTNISKDVVSIVTSLCIVHQASSVHIPRTDTTLQEITQLWSSLLDHVVRHQFNMGDFSASNLSEQLLLLASQDNQLQKKLKDSCRGLILQLAQNLHEAKESQRPDTLFDMDVMNDTTPASSQTNSSRVKLVEVSRRDIPATSDVNTISEHYSACLNIYTIELKDDNKAAVDITKSVIDYFISLDDAQLLACRTAATEYLEREAVVSRRDAARFLEKIGKAFMERQLFERCETALCFCLRLLKLFAHLWTLPDEDDLNDKAFELYDWFIRALNKGVVSPKVLSELGQLLGVVLTLNPSYGSEDLPSARTSLLKVLSSGNYQVKFYLSRQLEYLFDGYVLSEHESLLQDVVENLPNDADHIEGIATRLSVLATLGSRWHTLLRLTIYKIFETAAHVAPASSWALSSMTKMCIALHIESPRHLFALFCSQNIYTWFERSDISTIPYRAFGYKTLTTLCLDNLEEFVAQIALRKSESLAGALCSIIGRPWSELLAEHFGRAEAYAVASEMSSKEFQKVESTMRNQLGSEQHAELMIQNAAEVIATFFELVKNDEECGNGLENDKEHPHASAIWKQICKRSSSEARLPDRQQPCFKVKYISHWLHYLYGKARTVSTEVWDSALFVYVCRRLLKDASLPLGPLHTCAVLRKVRLLIAIAGDQAVSGYALEMVLRSLAPYVKSFHCAEDTIGIVWYLLEQGRAYLSTNLQFAAELSIIMFLHLADFATISQDSTTQESEFAATLSKAEAFRKWLKEYLVSLLGDLEASNPNEHLRQMFQSAGDVGNRTTSSVETPEGALLKQMLNDRCSEHPLLDERSSDHLLSLLTHEFEVTATIQSDILYEHDLQLRFAPVLCSAITRGNLNSAFKAWAASAIGLTWPANGLGRRQSTMPGHRIATRDTDEPSYTTIDSYSTLWDAMAGQLRSNDAGASAIAEMALQHIATSIAQEKLDPLPSLDTHLLRSLSFTSTPCPSIHHGWIDEEEGLLSTSLPMQHSKGWAATLGVKLCSSTPGDPVLPVIGAVLHAVPSTASQCLPAIVHLALVHGNTDSTIVKNDVTSILMQVLQNEYKAQPNTTHQQFVEQKRMAIRIILYLRLCALPRETTMAERNQWLDIDFLTAANAALECADYRGALLLAEIAESQRHLTASRSSRRSQGASSEVPIEFKIKVYQKLDDPDFFYGAHDEGGILSVVRKLDHEKLGNKALSFHSALYDAKAKLGSSSTPSGPSETATLAAALGRANLDGLARLLQGSSSDANSSLRSTSNQQTSFNLGQWDLSGTDEQDYSRNLANQCPSLRTAMSKETMVTDLNRRLATLTDALFKQSDPFSMGVELGTLSLLAEIKALLTNDHDSLAEVLDKSYIVDETLNHQAFDDISPLIFGREAFAGLVVHTPQLAGLLGFSQAQAVLHEVKTIRNSLSWSRGQDMGQFRLNRVVYLSKLKAKAQDLNLRFEDVIDYHVAKTLWDYDERSVSIQIMKELQARINDKPQDILVSEAEVLTELGSRIAQARLERPDEIVNRYLQPAIDALKGETAGSHAGRVFHNFAAFCDSQLQDQDNLDDFSRVSVIRESKQKELYDLQTMLKSAEGKTRDQLKMAFAKAKSWFKLDDEEFQRLKQNREGLLQACLENYLLSMRASDDFTNDTLRFLSLWLNRSDDHAANHSVHKYLASVPSIKLAPLMNQLSSRVLDRKDDFQKILQALVFRICIDHPFHGLYQLFATSKSKGAKGDEVAVARYTAATKIAESIIKSGPSGQIWVAVHNSSIACVRLATERLPEKETKTNSKIPLKKLSQGQKLEQTVYDLSRKIPPPTLKVALRPDKDYSEVPTISKFDSDIAIAGGVSAPKILSVYISDGSRHKMLFKGGNDDLRQDSIMEQVFEQVSDLLKDHRKTRQRNLGIRTYKVVPLTTSAGVIEFVQNTIPLHEYLLPAHARYFPKDYKASRCRKDISEAQSKSHNQRLQTYRTVTANFRPVMRFFFMERYLDPDEWFEKRQNYSRTTAAVSMLGYVLGLGDRHGHNILLDERSGEVVHIDLGVAFEAGRVLPVPEVVPFRLTRDLVDGMGMSGVEGVFRRCCVFTLEALREDQEAIMTILDVLRYDPLYSWSVSPIRLQKMLQNQEQEPDPENAAAGGAMAGGGLGLTTKQHVNEPSEADRALTVVSKKLGKSLSVEATVNELIRQATDEMNLAVLYCGWGAYV